MPLRTQRWLLPVLAVASTMAPSLAHAQQGAAQEPASAPRRDMRAPRPNETPEQRRARLLANLEQQVSGLSEEQKARILPIYEKSSDEMRALRQDKSLSPEQHEEKLRAIHAAVEAQVTPLLTEPQRAQRQQVLANARAVRLERRAQAGGPLEVAAPGAGVPGEARPPRTPEQTAQHILEGYEGALPDLSEEQKTQLHAVLLESSTKRAALRDDQSLSPAERDVASVRAQSESAEKASAILTPAQQATWAKAREERRKRMESRRAALEGRAETPEQKSERLLAPYAKALPDLSEAQKAKLTELLDASTDVIEEVSKDESRTPEQKASILARLHKKVDGQVAEVLTPAQRAAWAKSQPKTTAKK